VTRESADGYELHQAWDLVRSVLADRGKGKKVLKGGGKRCQVDLFQKYSLGGEVSNPLGGEDRGIPKRLLLEGTSSRLGLLGTQKLVSGYRKEKV